MEDIKIILEEHKRDIDKKFEETNRHFDVVAEDLKEDIKTVSEQIAANTEKLEEHDQRFNRIDQRFDKIETKLISHDQRFDKIDETLETIKLDVEVIKNDLKQKVGRDEFVILERRVSMLEAKQR